MEELQAIYDTRLSFYGKAKTETIKSKNCIDIKLYSYDVLVAEIVTSKLYKENKYIKRYRAYGKFSQTTTRHQKEFFKQNGLNDNDIKLLFADPCCILDKSPDQTFLYYKYDKNCNIYIEITIDDLDNYYLYVNDELIKTYKNKKCLYDYVRNNYNITII